MTPRANELEQSRLLHGASAAVLRRVQEHSAVRELAAGEVLLSPERDNHHVYLLLSGVLTVHFEQPDSPAIRELMPGVSVGEMSVIDGTPPSAYVIARDACRVLPLHRELIEELVGENNPVARNLLCMMSLWLKENSQRIVSDRLRIWELTDHANVDALTGLYNRRWFSTVIGRLLEQTSKNGQPLGLLLIDIDHFKQYNDRHGHLGGDQALVAMGRVLKTSLRPYDYATRYGGEEFAVLLPNTALDEAARIAERIRASTAAEAIVSTDGARLAGITVSIGLALSPGHATPEGLIGAADAQLYRAKHDGRDRVRY